MTFKQNSSHSWANCPRVRSVRTVRAVDGRRDRGTGHAGRRVAGSWLRARRTVPRVALPGQEPAATGAYCRTRRMGRMTR